MIQKISQSFIKSMRKYLAGAECGNIINYQWVEEKLLPSSDEMVLGQYFEYILGCELLGKGRGALPKDGIVPEAKYYAKEQKAYDEYKAENMGARLEIPEDRMLSEYRLAHVNARRVAGYLKKMGLKVLHVGKRYTKGRFNGLIDIVAECTKSMKFESGVSWKKGDKIVIDVKYSGLIDDRWNDMGWSWSPNQMRYHKTQAVQYNFLTGMPFFFLIVSSKNEVDIRMFYIHVEEKHHVDHIREGNFLMAEFKKAVEIGLVPRPEISRCNGCALRETCTDKHEYPHVVRKEIEEVEIINQD